MNRLESLNRRYEISARFDGASDGPVVIEAIPDPAGARFDKALRNVITSLGEDAVSFEELISPAKALRWKGCSMPSRNFGWSVASSCRTGHRTLLASWKVP